MPAADAVLHALARGDSARPRLTHYDDTGRIELSGRVLLNWIAKAANLLQEEFDVAPGSRIGLALPPTHWRTAYWAPATWALGATLVTDPTDPVDVLVTDDATTGQEAGDLVVVTLAALARRSPEPLPPGAFDEAAVLATYGDVLDPLDSADPDDDAWIAADATRRYADLADDPVASEERLLVTDDAGWVGLRAALSAWAGQGSLVVAPADADLERIAAEEGVTRRA